MRSNWDDHYGIFMASNNKKSNKKKGLPPRNNNTELFLLMFSHQPQFQDQWLHVLCSLSSLLLLPPKHQLQFSQPGSVRGFAGSCSQKWGFVGDNAVSTCPKHNPQLFTPKDECHVMYGMTVQCVLAFVLVQMRICSRALILQLLLLTLSKTSGWQ